MSTLALLALSLLVAQQPQQPQQSAAPQPPAAIEGTVMRAGSVPPAPLARARVVLSTTPRGIAETTLFTLLTDDAGRFAIKDIPPGTYNLMATRDGFVKATKPMTLAARESITNVVLDMTPTGAIAGRLRDRAGNLVVNATVQVQRYIYREGRRVPSDVQSAITNDLGEFRLFFLPPGQYVLSAVANGGPNVLPGPGNTTTYFARALPGVPAIGQLSGSDEMGTGTIRASVGEFLAAGMVPAPMTEIAEARVYFPGTLDGAAARVIDLAPGADFRNADFVLSEVRAGRIRGRVVNGVTGLPAGGVPLMLLSREDSGGLSPTRRNSSTKADGTFEFAGVAPGSYDLTAVVGTLPPGMISGGSGSPGGAGISPSPQRTLRDFSTDTTGLRLAARMPIQVASNDLDNIVLTASVGYTIKGRLSVDGVSAEENQRQVTGVAVQLMPTSGDFETAAAPAPVRPDGSFTIVGALPGTHRIWLMGATNMRSGLVYVKSATLGAVDVINPRFVLDKEPVGDLEIIVSTASGFVSASVVDDKGAPAAGVTVVLVPDLAHRQHYDAYSSTQSRPDGGAALNARPGDYTAYAFQNIEPNSWWDPLVLQTYSGQGTPVHIDEGKTTQLRLRTIR